jgi:hypothetical protein
MSPCHNDSSPTLVIKSFPNRDSSIPANKELFGAAQDPIEDTGHGVITSHACYNFITLDPSLALRLL